MAILPGSDRTGKTPEAFPTQMIPPGMGGYNVEPYLGIRRIAQLDNPARTAVQVETNYGVYSRPPILPVEYGEGNIKKSVQLTGAPGYNQRNIPLPESPDDMSQQQYFKALLQSKPEARTQLQRGTMAPRQNFLSRPSASIEYPAASHNMMNNLLALAKQKLGGKAK